MFVSTANERDVTADSRLTNVGQAGRYIKKNLPRTILWEVWWRQRWLDLNQSSLQGEVGKMSRKIVKSVEKRFF